MKGPIRLENAAEWKAWLSEATVDTWDWETMYPLDAVGVQLILAFFRHRNLSGSGLSSKGQPPADSRSLLEKLGVGCCNVSEWNPVLLAWMENP